MSGAAAGNAMNVPRGRPIVWRLIRRNSPARYHPSCPNARLYKLVTSQTLTANQSVVEIETIGIIDPYK